MGLFGIGDGEIKLQLKSMNVASGEALEGTVTLTINKDVKGRQVVATLYADRTETSINQGQPVTRNIRIYSKSETLDTEKLYTKQNGPYQYKLSFVIPQADANPGGPGGFTAGLIGNMFGGASRARSSGLTRWYVKVEFDHEAMLTFPIEVTQEINIVAQQQMPPAPPPQAPQNQPQPPQA